MKHLVGLLAMAGAVACAAFPARAANLHLEDLRKNVSITSPRISPDGKRIAVVVSRNDYVKDETHHDLVLVDVASHHSRKLLTDAKGLANFEWSPDGSAIAYVAGTESAQLYILPMGGGEPVQLTHEKTAVSDVVWRPDGRKLAFSSNAEVANHKQIEQHEDAFNVTDDEWTAQSAPVRKLLYEIPAAGGQAKQISVPRGSVGGGYVYSADGREIFVTRLRQGTHPNRYLLRDLVRIDIGSGTSTQVRLGFADSDPIRSKSGRIAFTMGNPHASMQTEVALSDSAGAHPQMLSRKLDRNIGTMAFLPDDSLLVSANDAAASRLFRIFNDGAVSVLPLGQLQVNDTQSASRNGTIAFTAAAPDYPTELYAMSADAKAPVRLTNLNHWIEKYALGKTRVVSWRTFDGLTADGVLTAPPDRRETGRAPLVLMIHGGPTAASTIAFSGFGQVLAARGWFVFQPNYRGSDNLGAQFALTTVPHITSVPGRDIEDGLTAVLRLGLIDEKKISVSGWSEGGLMTSWLITHDQRWKAAVSGAAVNDWVQYDSMTDAKDFSMQFIGASPWTSAQRFTLYEDESPLTFARNVRTPTLILSDASDFRVPTPLSYEFYHEVRATGTPVQFVIYPVDGHFPSDAVRREDVLRRWENWLAKYL